MHPNLIAAKDRLAAFCRTHGIRRLAVFESALRDDFEPDSAVDLLVDFDPGCTYSLLDLAGLELELSEMLGRPVYLVERVVVEESRNHIRRAAILESAAVIYTA